MNAFVEHHKHSIQFGYRCFDRLLLDGLIQPFQQPERVLGFFNTYREGKRVTRKTLTDIADQFQYWLKNRSQKWVPRFWNLPTVRATSTGAIGSWTPISTMPSPAKWWRSAKRGNRRASW